MEKDARIYIAGHNGMVGSAILRALIKEGYNNFLLRSARELDLLNQQRVWDFFEKERPQYVFLAAAKVGGIHANNTLRAEFIYNNLLIQSNVIHASYRWGVKKLLFMGSSCIYPKHAGQPLREEALLTGELETTNEPYAVAKIAGIKMCQAYHDQYGCNFISVMPTNLYGANDNFDLMNSHVFPAMIRKFHEAKIDKAAEVEIWGSGRPRREFLHVDDLADACVLLINEYDNPEIINIGTGTDISIQELALLMKDIIGFSGAIRFNTDYPDGTPRKVLDTSRINALGWTPTIALEEGIKLVYDDFVSNRPRTKYLEVA